MGAQLAPAVVGTTRTERGAIRTGEVLENSLSMGDNKKRRRYRQIPTPQRHRPLVVVGISILQAI